MRRDGKLCVEGSTIQDKPLKEYFWPILLQGNDLRLEDEYGILLWKPHRTCPDENEKSAGGIPPTVSHKKTRAGGKSSGSLSDSRRLSDLN